MKSAFSISLYFFIQVCWAQNSLDLATISYRYGAPQPAEASRGTAVEKVALINVKAPVVFSKSTIWYSDVTYQSSYVKYSQDFPSTVNPTKLTGLIIQTGLVRQFEHGTGFQLLVVPRLMTDFHGLDIGHFQLGGIGLFEKKYHDQLTMRYGLMYNREFFGNMFVPLIYIDWQASTRWSIKGLFPIFTKIAYQANEKFSFGLSHFGLITSYQVGDPAYSLDYIERKSIDLTVFFRYRLSGNIHFETRGGLALGRSYRQFAKGDEMDFRIAIFSFGDERVQKNVSFDPGPIIDVRLVYNLPLD
ncbi:MAG: DUF6268 family outer membrane beta-barrel protein [Cyclobacteriaceae bacterium]